MFCVLESLYQPLQGHKSKLPELKTGTCLSGPSTSATAWKKFSSLFPSTVLATAKLWSGNLEEILIALNQQLCYDSNKCFMLTKAYQWPFLLAISLTWLELCWPSLFRLVYFPKQKRPKHHPMHHRIVFFPFQAVWATWKSEAETLYQRSWEWYVRWRSPILLGSFNEIGLTCHFLDKVPVIPSGYTELFRGSRIYFQTLNV